VLHHGICAEMSQLQSWGSDNVAQHVYGMDAFLATTE
jgi:hypothetical protein